ncbi:MAG: hypothetical protein HND57_04885 [Planctomycetes bacterium]|nr:hypothetical protein [Planctomycetota bacterium]
MPDDTFKLACTMSDQPSTAGACEEALSSLARTMEGQTDFVCAFFSPHHVPRAPLIASEILDQLAPQVVTGASGAGVLANDHELQERPGLTIMAARMPGVAFHTFTHDDLDLLRPEPEEETLSQILGCPSADIRGMMLLPDPYTPLGRMISPLSRLINKGRSHDMLAPVFGGIASAGERPGDNRLILNEKVLPSGIVGLAWSGDIRMEAIVSQGCRPIGSPMIVTNAKRNIILSLGGRTPLQAVQQMATDLDPEDQELLRNGLFIGRVVNEYQDSFGRGDFLIRNVIGVDQKRGFVALNDQVRTGQTIQFHVRDANAATEDLELLLAAQHFDVPPLGGLLFTCTGRGSNLFDEPDHEVSTIRGCLPGTPVAGMFAAGEIGPIGAESFVHGHTACLVLMRGC